jgi:hypothetical protein
MSMSQANAALVMDVYAETARLGVTLTQAERMVDQAAQRMGQKIDNGFNRVGNQITRRLASAVGAGFAIKLVDDALRKMAEGIRDSKGAEAIGKAIGNGIVDTLKSLPVAGALLDLASQVGDKVLGGSMATEEARAQFQNFQRQQQAIRKANESAMGELELQGVTDPEVLARAERAREFYRLREIGERAKAGRVEIGADGVERELEEGIIARVRDGITAGLRKWEDARAARLAQEAQKQEQERIREEERKLKAQEEAYDRFVEANAQQAINMIEAQIAAMVAVSAPSRAERLAGLMDDSMGVATADTALGSFTYAVGGAAEVSAQILDRAEKQLQVLERIEELQEEANRIAEGAGLR